MAARKLKLAVVVSHPIQYFTPLYRHLSAMDDIDFTALYLSQHGVKPTFDRGYGATIAYDVPLLDGHAYKFVPNVAPKPSVGSFTGAVNPALVSILAKERYDFVWMHGWAQVSEWLAFGAAIATKTPFMLRCETTVLTTPRPSARLAKQVLVGQLMKRAAGGLYIGQENRRFYRAHGVSEDCLFFAPYGVDNAYFSTRAGEAVASGRVEALRASLGATSDDIVITFCAKFSQAVKGPLDAIAAARELGPRAVLVMIGDGPDRAQVESAFATSGVRGKLVGFVNQSQLPDWYAATDVLVLPSHIEPWGLVVNEAMACGTPAVVSDRVGCAADLVVPGMTGAIFRAEDVQALTRALKPFVDDPKYARSLRDNVRRQIAAYDASQAAAGIAAAARMVGHRDR